ncbi:MAG: hypothetical protein JXB35_06870 [Anaerolineae bacterium]|nr:hypothetical protein [Anaerolineae bacterium]
MALEEKPIPTDFVPDEHVIQAIEAHLKEGRLRCAVAFRIARDLGVEPSIVGRTADVLQVHLSRCQLGLFGYPEGKGWTAAGVIEKPVPDGLEAALRASVDAAGHIACVRLWAVAAEFGISRLQAGYVADTLGLHVAPCQLGAF